MKHHLGISIPKNYFTFKKGQPIEIKILKNKKQDSFVTNFNRIISLRKEICNNLNLKSGDIIEIEIRRPTNTLRENYLFKNNKIDMLALIQNKTDNRNIIFIKKAIKQKEEWLNIWSYRSKSTLKLKRFINIDIFGRLLGQLQAEGTKSGRRFRLEFCNKLIAEHIDYIAYLTELGIPKNLFICKCDFHSKVYNINKKVSEFESQVGIPIRYLIKSESSKGSYGFKTFIRNTLLTEIILNSLDTLRKKLIKESWDNNFKSLASAFFAKLLTGDGTLDITTKNRQFNFPEARIKITDGNIEYLKDYAEIMKKLGFKPHINEKHIYVRAYADFDKLLYLYKIKAFYNTPNWTKLIFLIDNNLRGRRLKTFLRFLDFLKSNKVITSRELVRNYNVGLRAANDWLNNKEKEGLLTRDNRTRPIKWVTTEKANKLAELLILYRKEFEKLNRQSY